MLKTRLLRLVGAIACAVVVVGGAEAQTILDQSHVRSTFANGSDAARAEMISQIRAIAPRNRPKWVLSELFNELNRLRRYLDDRLAAIEKGTPLPPEEDHGEYLIDVLSTVCEYDDPSIIGPLLPFIGSGNVLMNKLANFGDLAVPLVAGIAASPEKSDTDSSSALITLRRMLVQDLTRHYLSAASRRRMIEVAATRLQGKQAYVVAGRAIELGAATGDEGLRRRIAVLARDASAVRDLGITDVEFIQRLQKRASDALATVR